jgi:hypothetical protein
MANLKQEIINQFEGFGNNNKTIRGEHFRSSGFFKSKNGITTGGLYTKLIDFDSLTLSGNSNVKSLSYGRGFKTSNQSADNYLFNSSADGDIIQSRQGFDTPEYLHRSAQSHTYFHNLIVDPKGRLLYHQDRYLGMFNGTGTTTNYITGTVVVTNGSTAIVGTGTTFTADMVGKVIRIGTDKKFYTIATFTDTTHITINTYTGTTASGLSFVINTQFNDMWKDFGANVSLINGNTPNCPMDIYEDTVIIGRGNVIVTLNVTTDTNTTDAVPSLSFPAGYSIDHIVSNSNGILIAGNIRSKGFALLWDNQSLRSIAPWIWFDDTILSVCKEGSNWIITTSKAVYRTNGYSSSPITENLLGSTDSAIISNSPKNTVVLNNALHFFGLVTRGTRRAVLYKMDLTTKLVEAYPSNDLNQYGHTISQMEYVPESPYGLFLALNSTTSGTYYLYMRNAPICSTYITSPVGIGSNQKVATKLKVRIRRNTPEVTNLSNTFSFKIALKIADFKHTQYGFAQASATSADTSHITVNGTVFPIAKVGYEVEFLGDSSNAINAGYSRNVTSISGAGTNPEVWTLDEALPSIPQSGQNITITPFQLVKRKTISTTNGEIDEIVFNIKNDIKSNKFMFKIDIEDNTSQILFEIQELVFMYEDLGEI